MAASVDLDAYFRRIGYGGSGAPTLETLRQLHALQPCAIAFENLDSLMGRRVRIDAAAIQKKLIGEGRGGYCYELNGLLGHVLRTIGFEVAGLLAHALLGQTTAGTPRTHMILKVETKEGPHIADVGFGSRTLSAPLSLECADEQSTPHGAFRLMRTGARLEEQALMNGAWTSLYRFSLEEQTDADYEVCNWYHSTHPASPFTNRLMASRFDGARRLGLLNNRFTIHHPDGRDETRMLASADEIADVLETEFAIVLPSPREDALAALARATAES